MSRRLALLGLLLMVGVTPGLAQSNPDAPPAMTSSDDAWWTGPMLANSAATLPSGHALIESYVYDAIGDHANGARSLTYLLYGVTDGFTVGLVPFAGYNAIDNARSSSGVQPGDTQLRAQLALTSYDAARGIPDTAIALIQTVPTGKYDRLGERPGNGLGSGAYTTALAFYSQMIFQLPNGRPFRTRLDLSEGFSQSVGVQDVSVYGTGAGFRGTAQPGNAFSADASFEYSLTRNWVLAMDVIYNHGDAGITRGSVMGNSLQLNLGSSDGVGVAPALEFSWTPDLGVLLGTRIIAAGHNTPASITPGLAVNYVL